MQEVRKIAKVFIGSEALALFLTFLSQALSLYGLIDMTLARICLGLAWLIAVVGVLVSDYLCEKTWKHVILVTVLFAFLAGSGLVWLDRYATKRKTELEAAVYTVPASPPRPKTPPVPIKKTDWTAYRAALPTAQRVGNNSTVVSGKGNSATNVPNATAPGISQVTMGGGGTISNNQISGNSLTVGVPTPFNSAPGESRAHSTTTAFSGLSSTELKKMALDVASAVSDLIAEMRVKEAENESKHRAFSREHREISSPEAQVEWDRYSYQGQANRQNALDKYKRFYRADAVALKNEMLNRLPVGSREPQIDNELMIPTNTFGLEDIVTYLQILANSLKL